MQPAKSRLSLDSGSSDSGTTPATSKRFVSKSSGACVHCKSLKVRCEFSTSQTACQRCTAGGFPCIPRSRKKRKPAPTHEDLQEKAYAQDAQIQALLLRFDQLKTQTKLAEWIKHANYTPFASRADSDTGLQGPSHQSQGFTRPSNAVIKREEHMNINWNDKMHTNSWRQTPHVAAMNYFPMPDPSFGLSVPAIPPIVEYCSLYPDEIVELFQIYFEKINTFFSLLDEHLHTPARLIWTSHFLFTVIISTASRYYTRQPNLYKFATSIALDMAGMYLTCVPSSPVGTGPGPTPSASVKANSFKSIDVCQAYLILGVYPTPKKRWSDDRSWILMGVAIRMAIELGLNDPRQNQSTRPSQRHSRSDGPGDIEEREQLNRTRTWLNCYCVDGSHAIQFGKMAMLPLSSFPKPTSSSPSSPYGSTNSSYSTCSPLTTDYVAINSREWYHSSGLNTPYDVHLTAYVQLIRIMGAWRSFCAGEGGQGEEPEELSERWRKGFDVITEALKTEDKLIEELDYWVRRYTAELVLFPLQICAYRGTTTQMISAYLRLVVLVVGFQYAVKEGLGRSEPTARTDNLKRDKRHEVLRRSIEAARSVIQITIERLYPTGHFKYAMEASLLYVSYAAAYLINLLRPKFLPLIDYTTQEDIVISVRRLIDILSSDYMSLDGRLTPMSYARFLKMLMEKRGIAQLTFDDYNTPGHGHGRGDVDARLDMSSLGGYGQSGSAFKGSSNSTSFDPRSHSSAMGDITHHGSTRNISPIAWPDIENAIGSHGSVSHGAIGASPSTSAPSAGIGAVVGSGSDFPDGAGIGMNGKPNVGVHAPGAFTDIDQDVAMDFSLGYFMRSVSAQVTMPAQSESQNQAYGGWLGQDASLGFEGRHPRNDNALSSSASQMDPWTFL